MTPDEFGAKIKAKYPDYASVDNVELSRRIVAKHPEYASQVEFKDAVAQPNADNISTMGAAGKAISETMTEDVPYLGKVARAVREDIPGFIAEKAGQVGASVEKAGQAIGLPKAGELVGKAIGTAGASTGAAIGTAGELIPQKGWELAALGAAKPLAAAGKAAGRVAAPKLISFLTRIEPPIVARAIARAGEIGKKELMAPDAIENAIKGLGEGIKAGRRALGQRLAAIEDDVAERLPGRIIPVNDIASKLESRLSRAGFSDAGDVERKLESKIGDIVNDFRNMQGGSPERTMGVTTKAGGHGVAPISTGKPILDNFGNPILVAAEKSKPLPLSFADGLNLRRKIDDVLEEGNKGLIAVPKQTSAFLMEARSELNARLKNFSGHFKNANDAFAKMAGNYKMLEDDILSGKPETIQRRITSMFNKGSADRKIVERVDRISEEAGVSLDTILNSITAQKFSPVMNPTVERAAFHTGGGILGASGVGGAVGAAAALGHPLYAAGVGGAIAATSPKLHGLAIRAFASPIGKTQIPGIARGATSAALAALRAQRGK